MGLEPAASGLTGGASPHTSRQDPTVAYGHADLGARSTAPADSRPPPFTDRTRTAGNRCTPSPWIGKPMRWRNLAPAQGSAASVRQLSLSAQPPGPVPDLAPPPPGPAPTRVPSGPMADVPPPDVRTPLAPGLCGLRPAADEPPASAGLLPPCRMESREGRILRVRPPPHMNRGQYVAASKDSEPK
jgi:hypothetical protein